MSFFHYCATQTPDTGRIPVSEDKLRTGQTGKGISHHPVSRVGVGTLKTGRKFVQYGDWWFDIDHPNLADAITSLHRLMDVLASLDVNLDHLRYYASGSKGFHIRVPASLF
jgi:hypothetical protein